MFRKFLLGAALLAALALVVIVIPGQAAPAEQQPSQTNQPEASTPVLQANLSGENEVPAVDTPASGRAVFVVDVPGNTLHYWISVANIENITSAYIQNGAAGEEGDPLITLYDDTSSDPFDTENPLVGSTTLSQQHLAELWAGSLYVNINTETNPEGEIRGQLEPFTPVREFRSVLSGAEEVPPVDTEASGQAYFRLNHGMDKLHYEVAVSDIQDITAAHLHTGMPGEEGPPVITLFDGEPPVFDPDHPISGEVDITPEQLLHLVTGNMYVNVHTDAYPEGEIRGQVGSGYYAFTADLTGAGFPSPVQTTGGGQAFFVLDPTTGRLLYRLTLAGLTDITGAKIYAGQPGETGIELLTLFEGAPTLDAHGSVSGTVNLPIESLQGIATGDFFVVVTTAANPNGELRGQIQPWFMNKFNAILTGAEEVPPVETDAYGLSRFRLHSGMTRLDYSVAISGGLEVVAAHLHVGWPSEVGPPVIPFDVSAGDYDLDTPIAGTAELTADNLLDLISGRLYANVHTPEHPQGEIRGQVRPAFHLFGAKLAGEGSSATGNSIMILGADLQTLFYYIDVSEGITPTAAHIHIGHPSQGGEMIFDLLEDGQEFNADTPLIGSLSLTPEQAAHLVAGDLYLAVLGDGGEGDEIVGRIMPFIPRLDWLANLIAGSGGGQGPGGAAHFWYNHRTGRLHFEISTSGLTGINVVRLRHTNGTLPDLFLFGGEGNPPFSNGSQPLTGSVGLDEATLLALLSGEMRLEVLSGGDPSPALEGTVVQAQNVFLPLTLLNAGQ